MTDDVAIDQQAIDIVDGLGKPVMQAARKAVSDAFRDVPEDAVDMAAIRALDVVRRALVDAKRTRAVADDTEGTTRLHMVDYDEAAAKLAEPISLEHMASDPTPTKPSRVWPGVLIAVTAGLAAAVAGCWLIMQGLT